MMWLLSQLWVVALVALVSGFVVTWLLVVRRVALPQNDTRRSAQVRVPKETAAGRDAPRPDASADGSSRELYATPEAKSSAIGFDLEPRRGDRNSS